MAKHAAQATRRDVLVGASAVAVLAPISVGAQPGGASVSGVVFHDRTGDGRRHSGDKGLANVMVSNGRDVALTDADGRYTLPLPDEAIIFVIKPAGFMPPVDPSTRLPLFYRVHQPRGTPPQLNLAHPGIAPTDPLPASLDFPLRAQEEPSAFDVVLLTDPQPADDHEIDFIRDDIVEALAGTSAKFGITAGDIMFDDLSLYDRYNRLMGTIGIPWWNIGGNHDLNYEAPGRRYSRETFKRVFGPHYFAFEYAQATFLMLDDVDYLGGGPDRYEARLDDAQLQFVRNVLSYTPRDRLVAVVLHIPLQTYVERGVRSANLVNRQALFDLLKGRSHTVSFAGHTHTTEHHYLGAEHGWPNPEPHHHHVLTAASGSWWSGPKDRRGVACADSCDGSPNGFHILSVDGVSYRTRFVAAKEPNGRQIRIMLAQAPVREDDRAEVASAIRPSGARIRADRLPEAMLIANVFDGGPRTRVEVFIDDRGPLTMAQAPMSDPFVLEQFASNSADMKPWVKAVPSSHVWSAPLPPDLCTGPHRFVVSATNEYGETVLGRLTLEVV